MRTSEFLGYFTTIYRSVGWLHFGTVFLFPSDFVPLLLKTLPIRLSHGSYKCPLDAER